MKRACAVLVALSAILIWRIPAWAEWQNYGPDDGLASNYVYAILEDGSGNLWFGTYNGVSRYNGVSWMTYTKTDGLAGEEVHEILEHSSGDIWIAAISNSPEGGVSRFDGMNWTTYTSADGLAGNYVTVIFEDSSANIWIAAYGESGFDESEGGVSRFDGTSWMTFRMSDGLASEYVNVMHEDSAGNLWFGTGNGVSRYDGVNWTTYSTADGLAGYTVTGIVEDSSGNLWFGTYAGLSRYDGVNWTTYSEADGLAGDAVREIAVHSSGDIWVVGSSFWPGGSGLSRFDGTSWTTFTTADGLLNDYITAIFEDSLGDMWFGTEGGVSRYDGFRWENYTVADGLTNDDVWVITEDSSGNLWLSQEDNGASRYDRVSWRTYTTEDGLTSNSVTTALYDSSDNLWFGSYEGVSRYDGVGWTSYTAADGIALGEVTALLEDSSGDLWVATSGDISLSIDGGVSQFDGVTWRTFTTADGLASGNVRAVLEDRSGNLWFGSGHQWLGFWGEEVDEGGVSQFDGANWTTYTAADGLAGNNVTAITEDSLGNLWVAVSGDGEEGGVSQFDGLSWTTYTAADGLAGSYVGMIFRHSSGDLWIAAQPGGSEEGGLSRFDGTSWTTFRTSDGLASEYVNVISEDSSGNLWFGTSRGVSRYDGLHWATYTTADGLGDNGVEAIMEDSSGNLWFGTNDGGVSRYDGESWIGYTTLDGLADPNVSTMIEDRAGCFWFAGYGGYGLSRHEPDRVPPQTVIWPRLPSLIATNKQTVTFAAAFKETQTIEFSYSFDATLWSDWSAVSFWIGSGLPDGEHAFRVRSRDRFGNVDPTPAVSTFEIDAKPPEPVIAFPVFGQAVRDSILIEGTADDLRFRSYRVEVREAGSELWDLVAESTAAVHDGILAGWNTASRSDGDCELRLSVADTLDLVGTYLVEVVVDNKAPWAYETTPALIKAAVGGDVYTTNREAHLYFPPSGFAQDTEVRIEGLSKDNVPDTLSGGAVRVLAGYEIAWGDSLLAKPGTLEMSYEGMEFDRDAGPGAYPDENTFAIFMLGSDSEWQRLGGTIDKDAKTISASFTKPGLYSVFAGGLVAGGGTALSALSITPRVFSPSGGFASNRAAIGFTLGRPGPVTVKIYNRAGRLVSEVASGEDMTAGANLVQWDGRGRDGDVVEDGIYLVTVEALGHKQVKPLAVVR